MSSRGWPECTRIVRDGVDGGDDDDDELFGFDFDFVLELEALPLDLESDVVLCGVCGPM